MKKGRHRRFEEARALKRSTELIDEPCPECGAEPDIEHASWCLAMEDEEEPEEGVNAAGPGLSSRYVDAPRPIDSRTYTDSSSFTDSPS